MGLYIEGDAEALRLWSARLACCFHFRTLATVSFKVRLAFQPSIWLARLGSATKAGGSPGRRGTVWRRTALPVTSSVVLITSSTEFPSPVPRFSAKEEALSVKC